MTIACTQEIQYSLTKCVGRKYTRSFFLYVYNII